MKKTFQNKGFHLGKMLASYFQAHKTSRTELARKIGRSYKTLKDFEKNSSLQVGVLWEISEALECNFFQNLANCFPDTYDVPTNLEGLKPSLRKDANEETKKLEEEIQALKQQLMLLEHENKVLKDLIRR